MGSCVELDELLYLELLYTVLVNFNSNSNSSNSNNNREVLGNMAVLDTISGFYTNIWIVKAEGTTDVCWHHLHVVHITPLYSFECVPIETTCYKIA